MPTPAAAPIEPIEVGEEVECTWGAGIIQEVRSQRERGHMHILHRYREREEGGVGSLRCCPDVYDGGRRAKWVRWLG